MQRFRFAWQAGRPDKLGRVFKFSRAEEIGFGSVKMGQKMEPTRCELVAWKKDLPSQREAMVESLMLNLAKLLHLVVWLLLLLQSQLHVYVHVYLMCDLNAPQSNPGPIAIILRPFLSDPAKPNPSRSIGYGSLLSLCCRQFLCIIYFLR